MSASFKPLCAAALLSFTASLACAAGKGTILSAPRTPAAAQAAAARADAQPQASAIGHEAQLTVAAGKGEMVRLSEPATAVFVADPEIADVNVPNPRAVFVLGKKAGTTTLYVLGANNKQVLRQTIVVSQDITTLDSILRQRFPTLHLQLISTPGSRRRAQRRRSRHHRADARAAPEGKGTADKPPVDPASAAGSVVCTDH